MKVPSESRGSSVPLSLILLRNRRDSFAPEHLRILYLGIGTFMVSEFLFTLYADVYGIFNFLGHLLKLFAYYFLYKALVDYSLTKPFRTLFREADERIRELTELNGRIDTMYDKLVQSEKLGFLGKLSAAIAHEMNTPLSVIVSTSRISAALQKELFPASYDRVRKMGDEEYGRFRVLAERALRPIDDQASLTRSEEGRRDRLRALAAALAEEGREAGSGIIDLLEEMGVEVSEAASWKALLNSPHMAETVEDLRGILFLYRSAHLAFFSGQQAERAICRLRLYSTEESADPMSALDLGQLVDAVLALYEPSASENVRIRREYEPKAYVLGHANHLSLVIKNLVENALQAMSYRGELTLRIYRQGEELVLAVRDSGGGILPEHRGRIFDPFFTTKGEGDGIGVNIGLGLTMCKKFVEEHGGRIAYSGEAGATEFRVHLPAAKLS